MGKGYLLLISLIITLFASFYLNSNENLDKQYQEWKRQFGIRSSSNEDFYRKIIFKKNLELIQSHNNKPEITYELGINQFAHLTMKEFQSIFTSSLLASTPSFSEKILSSEEKIKIEVGDTDWEAQGKVSPVKNQGSCDAGYAFCTTSLFQSYLLMKNQKVGLSEQQMIDCGGNYTMMGCSGGSRLGAINYTNDKGLEGENNYPFTGKQGTCQKQTGSNKFSIKLAQADGCNALANLLVASPVTIAVNTQNWQLYRSGIFSNCGDSVNHDIYLVGVSEKYWRLKNSWGVRWGQFGYIRLAAGNTCGICSRTGYGFIPE